MNELYGAALSALEEKEEIKKVWFSSQITKTLLSIFLNLFAYQILFKQN